MTNLKDKTYALLRTVPKGKVTTYKALADKLGTKAYRAIGQCMRTNPYAPDVPCHRVVASDGTIGGFRGQTTGKEIQDKIRMLKEEGVDVVGNSVANFSSILYEFN